MPHAAYIAARILLVFAFARTCRVSYGRWFTSLKSQRNHGHSSLQSHIQAYHSTPRRSFSLAKKILIPTNSEGLLSDPHVLAMRSALLLFATAWRPWVQKQFHLATTVRSGRADTHRQVCRDGRSKDRRYMNAANRRWWSMKQIYSDIQSFSRNTSKLRHRQAT
eukprot:scaffold1771_cov172-Amphora_coffeaeformis.AAC.17